MAWRGSVGRLMALSGLGCLGLGCDAQVGDEYTGEVMFSVRGHVNAPPDNHADLVPAIGMFRPAARESEPSTSQAVVMDFMAAKVEGIFPSDFRLRVAEAPELNGWPMALGALVLVPRDTPPSVEMASTSFSEVEPTGDLAFRDPEPGEVFVERQESCRASGECVVRRLECVRHPCEVIATFGERIEDESDPSYGESACQGGFCYQTSVECYHDASCLRELIRCDVSAPGSEREDDMVKTCSLLSETGDTSISTLDSVFVAQNKLVLYSTQAGDVNVLFPLEDLKAGYNLIEITSASSSEEWIRISSCRFDAKLQAIREHNEAQGSSERYEDLSIDDQQTVSLRADELSREDCPVWQVVEDTAEVLLDLDLERGVGR